MIAEIGHFALLLALMLAAAQSVAPVWGVLRDDTVARDTAVPLAIAQFGLVTLAFGALTYAYLVSDFSLLNVWENSHTDKPLLYKLTGTWGNHEGSMLLWILILALFGASVALFGRHLPARLRALTLAVQGWVALAFLLFLVFTSNPFERLDPVPFEGRDLNPVLQDIGLAIHPPLLYLGYVGFSIVFAFAVAALIDGRVDAAWARWVRPWTLAAWTFLTLGIAMGSYWAYYELGWGGWWFWDPVENASLMPWLSGTALLHSAIVVEKRGALKVWTVLLAILTFSLSLLGTFLVRSGVLTSVHAFATDPTRGVVILAILCVFIGGSLALFAWRAPTLERGGLFAPVSREGALVLNNLFLSAACATVLVGTLYPLAYEAWSGQKITVGPPFFNLSMLPLTVPLLLALPFGPFLAWKRSDLLGVSQRLVVAGLVAILGAVAFAAWRGDENALAPLGVLLGLWLVAGAISEPLWRAKLGRVPASETLRRLANLPRAAWGGTLGHLGIGITTLGVVLVTSLGTERVLTMVPGDVLAIRDAELRYDDIRGQRGPNYVEDVASFTILRDGAPIATVRPAKRIYEARRQPTTEAGIATFGASQTYVSVGEVDTETLSTVVRVWEKPFVLLIWIGAVVMSLGGLVSLSDRRLRIGVPRRARSVSAPGQASKPPLPRPGLEPAE